MVDYFLGWLSTLNQEYFWSPPATVSSASHAPAAVTTAHFKATNAKHEQSRRYLEKLGALDLLTKVLAALCE